jgi:hypothetical protein
MGAIHGFDSTSGEKSVSVTKPYVFPRFAAQCSALVSSGRSGSGETPFTVFPAAWILFEEEISEWLFRTRPSSHWNSEDSLAGTLAAWPACCRGCVPAVLQRVRNGPGCRAAHARRNAAELWLRRGCASAPAKTRKGRARPLLSGYKLNKFSWLAESTKFSWESGG